MTRWKVGQHPYGDRVYDEKSDFIAKTMSLENAAQIVRDHNRAEAFEAMRVNVSKAKSLLCIPEKIEYMGPYVAQAIDLLKAALALAEKEEIV